MNDKKTASKKSPAKAPAKKAVAKVATKKAAPKAATKAAPKAAPKAAVKKAAPKKAAAKVAVKKAAPKKAAAKVAEKVVVKAPVAKKVAAKPAAEKFPQTVNMSARVLFTLRAEDVQLLDLRGISDVADFYLVATCGSEAQMQAILDSLSKELKAAKIPTVGVEYRSGVQWAVLDVGEIMVHLFEENKRREFALDLLWRDGKIVELKAEDFVAPAKSKKAVQSDDFV